MLGASYHYSVVHLALRVSRGGSPAQASVSSDGSAEEQGLKRQADGPTSIRHFSASDSSHNIFICGLRAMSGNFDHSSSTTKQF